MAGLALRLLFDLQFWSEAGDSSLYLQLGRNLADHHIYGLWQDAHLVPTDLRVPGYPAFLAGVSWLFGRSMTAIALSQTALDLITCILTAALAAALASPQARHRVWVASLWLAMTCPFVASYNAVILTEVVVAFFTTAALACFVMGLRESSAEFALRGRPYRISPFAFPLGGAFLTGMATLLRPEMPLLLVAAGAVFALRWWKSFSLGQLARKGVALAAMFLIPLAPWAVRNYITLGEVQILAPRYAMGPGEYAPVGYYAWTGTWLERFRDVYTYIWNVGEEVVTADDLPPSAYDSPEEKARVAALFDEYNKEPEMDITPEVDRKFAELARERTRRHPFRTYVEVPFERALTIWFTPRTELLPIDGKLWPLRDQWQDSHADVLATAGLAALGYLYAALALFGLWRVWRASRAGDASSTRGSPNLWGVGLIVLYLVVRTAFLTTVEAPEPRYVVSCYPAVLALVALAFAWKREV